MVNYDIIHSGDFELDLDNMFDLLIHFRGVIDSKKDYLEHMKDCGAKYEDDGLYFSQEYSIEKLQSVMQREINAIDELGRVLMEHLDLFHDWD